ncbi:response regulator transcription factor [Pueribacillus sp. YX66]|uniref:response regulator transcription factor n=1 Tax=Pueribacillus sp. YX66 TaxID=3229242 RepID=UPI00358D28CB
MQITLSQQLKNVLETGVDIVRDYRQPIEEKWKSRLSELQDKQNKTPEDFQIVISMLSDCLFYEETDIEGLFKKLNDKKFMNCQPVEPNKLVFYITLLENSVHEVIKSHVGNAYDRHQAVQYLFSKINEEIFSDSTLKRELDLNSFLEQLVRSRQLPIIWAAKLIRLSSGFQVKDIFSSHSIPNKVLQFNYVDSLFKLSEHLLESIPSDTNECRVFPIPWGDYTLLFCSTEPESEIVPFIMFSLQTFLEGREALKATKRKQQWMDAVILFNEWIMRSKSYYQALKNIASGFVNYLPFERCALFAYSNIDQLGVGLFAHSISTEAIQNINENINNLPFIKKHLQHWESLSEHAKNIQPLYISEAIIGLPEQYVKQFQLESVVLVPIYVPSESRLIGAAIVDQGPKTKFKLSRETFLALMKFGQSAGELLTKISPDESQLDQAIAIAQLSPREIEVLQLIAEGKSTHQAAQRLHLSEYTVRDYISTIMQKMKAKNRTEAIVKAIRKGII